MCMPIVLSIPPRLESWYIMWKLDCRALPFDVWRASLVHHQVRGNHYFDTQRGLRAGGIYLNKHAYDLAAKPNSQGLWSTRLQDRRSWRGYQSYQSYQSPSKTTTGSRGCRPLLDQEFVILTPNGRAQQASQLPIAS